MGIWSGSGKGGFLVLRIWPIFGSVFVKDCGVLCCLQVFSSLVNNIGQYMMAVFRICLSTAFYGFSEVTLVIPRDL